MGALRLAQMIAPRAERGQVWLRSGDGAPLPYDVIDGEPVAWSKNVIWGASVLLGDSAYVHLAAWDDNIIWGQRLDNIVWGQCRARGCHSTAWQPCAAAPCDDIAPVESQNIVWGESLDNVVWAQCHDPGCDSLVRGPGAANVVWGQDGSAQAYWAQNTVWGFWDGSVDWTRVSFRNRANIVWGQDYLNNVVWGECASPACVNIAPGEAGNGSVSWQSPHVITLGGHE
jgi:hypothetical protein